MKIVLSAALIISFSLGAFAQQDDLLQTLNIDSLQLQSPDTLLSSITDSSIIQPKKKSDLDTVVYASGSDSLFFFVKEKKMSIYGEGKINYRKSEIKSANIFLDFTKFEIEAVGVPGDSASNEIIGSPVLSEDGEVYTGKRMRYNFKTGQGSLAAADTELEGAFYHGAKIKKVAADTYFIEDGVYTTCDAEEPHYFFSSPKMKMIQGEELAAEWIWLNFGGVPAPIPLPFIIVPLQSGRRSGLIPPVFGSDARYGTYINRFGYFWAMSDYMDINATMDYYTRGSFGLGSRFRYANRYNYNGFAEGSYRDFTQGESTDPGYSKQIDWRIKVFHAQSFTPTLRLDANLEFASQDFLQNGTGNLNDLLRNEIISNATLSKTWDESGNSASINYNRRQVLETNDIYEVLPSALFRLAQSYPFRTSSGEADKEWYELFGYSYTGQFQNQRNKTRGVLDERLGLQHSVTADMSPKIGYFTLSPRIRFDSKWYNEQIEQFAVASSAGRDSIITNEIKELSAVNTFDVGLNASTKFYGMFNINSLGINAIRHTVTPSISYNYSPDFSEQHWGYYGQYTKSDGSTVNYNKYQKEVYGGASAGEQQNINFSLGNNFEMKTTVDPTDTTSKENKIQLLNVTLGTGYNFAADSLNFADINLTYRTQIGEFFDLSGSSRFTPYDYSGTSSKINRYLVDAGKGVLRLTGLNFSVSSSLSGEKFASSEKEAEQKSDEFGLVDEQSKSVYQGIYNNQDPDFTIPWSIALTYNYNLDRNNPGNPKTFSNLSGSFSFSLTPSWKFDVTGSYDIESREFAAPQITISKDLHCWFMNFIWNPIGTYTGFRFEIRVKAPMLQDLKLTKQDQFFNTR
ncbi:MAG: LPS-assembly protein LptD [Ignavibacteriaceae bacterium]|nr:LPS-assembly protein LptD [Ignavibacteriaceae bacterium]